MKTSPISMSACAAIAGCLLLATGRAHGMDGGLSQAKSTRIHAGDLHQIVFRFNEAAEVLEPRQGR